MILVISKTILKNSSGTVKKFSKVILFNCFACFWPNGYQRESLGKSHQNSDYFKEAMRKSCLPTGFEPAILIIKVNYDVFDVEQWTGNPNAAGFNPERRQVFRIASFK